MTAAVATRAPNARARTTPPGTGELHRALEDQRDLASLHDFCSAHVCTKEQVSKDGKRLDMLMVFDLMRSRGYQISAPEHSQHQPKKGFTAWIVDVQFPNGHSCAMAFYTINTPDGRHLARSA